MRWQGDDARDLAWTVAGATAGALARYGVGQMWPGRGQALGPTAVLAAAAAGLIGFAFVASLRLPMKKVLIAAGGAAGSISAAATQAASATPVQSIVGVAAFVGCAVAGLLLGMLLAWSVLRNAQRKERR
jgi:fluoride ion exporter CrcB/FEX